MSKGSIANFSWLAAFFCEPSSQDWSVLNRKIYTAVSDLFVLHEGERRGQEWKREEATMREAQAHEGTEEMLSDNNSAANHRFTYTQTESFRN